MAEKRIGRKGKGTALFQKVIDFFKFRKKLNRPYWQGYDFDRKRSHPHYYRGLKLFEYSFEIRFLYRDILKKIKIIFSFR